MTLSAEHSDLVLAQNASARVPAKLIVSTINAAATCSSMGQAVATGLISADVAALTEGVLRTMFYAQVENCVRRVPDLGRYGPGSGCRSYRGAAVPA